MHVLRLILLTVLFLGLAVFLAYTLQQSIRTGVIRQKGGRKCQRSKQPVCYWTAIVINIVIACISTCVSVLSLVDLVHWKGLPFRPTHVTNACVESARSIAPVVLAQMKYPPSAVEPGERKKGVFELVIGPTGTIDEVIVAKPSGYPALDELARKVLLNTPVKLPGCIQEGRSVMDLTF